MTEYRRGPRVNRFLNPQGVTPPSPRPQRQFLPLEPVIAAPLLEVARLYQQDPLGFVQSTFEWTEGETLEAWQQDVLATIGEELGDGRAIHRFAIASGKGAGKTTLSALLFLWHLACHEGKSQTLATSVTGFQTRSRFWREVMKWRRRWTLRTYFKAQSTRLEHVSEGETWFASHQTWSLDRPEAFQGTHELHTGFFVDEASAIPDEILNVIESGATDQHVIIVYISNPTRATGKFRECFRQQAEWWVSWSIDTRNVSRNRVSQESIDKALAEANNDEESFSFRMNVRGEFPLQDYDQVIPEWIILKACERTPAAGTGEPIVIGADIARKGQNKTVFTVRQGDRILEIRSYTMQEVDVTAERLEELIQWYKERYEGYVYGFTLSVYVDADGIGAGVVDICRRHGYRVREVRSGSRAMRDDRFVNLRAELWHRLREWLKVEGCIDKKNKDLQEQLIDVYYKHDDDGRILIESKEEMLARGIASPDYADSLVYTFAGVGAQVRTMNIRF